MWSGEGSVEIYRNRRLQDPRDGQALYNDYFFHVHM
jgi:hypothetical protein